MECAKPMGVHILYIAFCFAWIIQLNMFSESVKTIF